MINTTTFTELIFGQMVRDCAYRGLFPETGASADDRVNALNLKLYDFLSSMGMKLPVGFRHFDLCSLYKPYRHLWAYNQVDGTGSNIHEIRVLGFVSTFVQTLSSRADDFVRRMGELCLLFGVDLTAEEKDIEINKYLYLELLQQTIPQLKFSTNLAFTRFWKEVSPEGSCVNFMGLDIFPNRLRVILNRISSKDGARRMKNQILINTLFQGYKKGLLPAGPEIVQKSLNTNRVKLTKDGTISHGLYASIQDKTRAIMSYGKRLRFNDDDTLNQSSHSTLLSGYADGGNIGFVQREVHGDGPYLVREFIGYCFDKEDKAQLTPIEVRSFAPVFLSSMLEIFRHVPFGSARGPEARKFLNNLFVAPACILEPMKVRIITKPSTGLHVRMHKVQKSLWNFLYRHETSFFDLIGEPLTPNHLYPLLKDMKAGDKICSGDYSAATDNLKGEVSEAIAKELFHDLNDQVLSYNIVNSLMKTTVLQSQLVKPKWNNVFDEYDWNLQDFEQVNGQLMGHVISFVILCIANVIAYWESLEQFHRRDISLDELVEKYPVRVNGDDIIFRSNDAHYSCWLDTISSFGFEPSVGKNFFNDKFLQVNSELYRLDTHFDEASGMKLGQIVHIPYVNFGLLTNRSKQDCSKDTSVQRIEFDVSSLPSKGKAKNPKQVLKDIPSEILLGRLKTYPFIYEKLMKGLSPQLSTVVNTLVKRHFKPVFEAFGLGSTFKHLGHEGFRDQYGRYVVKNIKIYDPDESSQLECFGDLSQKLDRGQLDFEFSQVRPILRICRENPFFYYPRIGIEKKEFVRA